MVEVYDRDGVMSFDKGKERQMELTKEADAQELEKMLEQYRKGPFNVLVPTVTIQQLSPYHKPVLEVVKINPDPKAGEVYEIISGSGDFSMRATALQKISYAAGLIWNARGSGRTDDGSNPNIVVYRAEAALRKEDGTFSLLNAEYMVDLEVIEQETRESYEKKGKALASEKNWSEKARKDYVENGVHRDMLQKRKFRLQLAQTGAMDRVIRKILGLKGTYKKAELDKSFVVPKIAFHPDIADPEVRKMLLRQGMEASTSLFGPPIDNIIDRAALPEKTEPINVTPGKEEPEVIETEPIEKQKVEEKTFDEMDEKGQIAFLQKLMKQKGYDEKKMKKPLSQFTQEHRRAFKEHLEAMDNVEELPFE